MGFSYDAMPQPIAQAVIVVIGVVVILVIYLWSRK
jgi:hypothetical protein